MLQSYSKKNHINGFYLVKMSEWFYDRRMYWKYCLSLYAQIYAVRGFESGDKSRGRMPNWSRP